VRKKVYQVGQPRNRPLKSSRGSKKPLKGTPTCPLEMEVKSSKMSQRQFIRIKKEMMGYKTYKKVGVQNVTEKQENTEKTNCRKIYRKSKTSITSPDQKMLQKCQFLHPSKNFGLRSSLNI
jgi:hypothetical protein